MAHLYFYTTNILIDTCTNVFQNKIHQISIPESTVKCSNKTKTKINKIKQFNNKSIPIVFLIVTNIY